jgi:hypothetical protein
VAHPHFQGHTNGARALQLRASFLCLSAASAPRGGHRRRAWRTAQAASTDSTPVATIRAGSRPSVRWPRNARVAWLESTEPSLWLESAEPEHWTDSSEAADIEDPIDPAEAKEPMLANDAQEPRLPIESTECREQIDSTESSDHRDHTPEA